MAPFPNFMANIYQLLQMRPEDSGELSWPERKWWDHKKSSHQNICSRYTTLKSDKKFRVDKKLLWNYITYEWFTLLNTVHQKKRKWISGWLIPFNIQPTTKIIIFFDIFQFPSSTQNKVLWESIGKILRSADFQNKIYSLYYCILNYVLFSNQSNFPF